ncbi:hypothetical protein ATO6_09960 [Oceanicola sp. 22II-s10i]|uniref:DUF6477 family protein n=1 Tax=Oceanicola sp. 22II-s10i TaxID=1317116 RepID=UPI000B524A1A|nr:DUF6477 family protein [Oceanicola sp. 22II-s10i]OWU85331.1 hypothetical protein ATO6_09960 [Oceanicola sp. 22II-s10i]
MQDALTRLSDLRRPRLLMTAARIGADGYRRESVLPRYFGLATLPRSAAAMMALLEIEAELDHRRRSGDAGYSVIRHVDVMSAILGEARILRSAQTTERPAGEVLTGGPA